MDQIQHKHVEVNGLKLHVAEIGTGPTAVMFLHGFPEIWYSWRHQMIALADAGYRAIAPDYRGYGLSDPPLEPEKTSHFDFIDDLVAILDAFDIPKVFLVAKDFGSRIAYLIALMYPKRISGVVTMGLPFRPPRRFLHLKMEVVRNIYILFSKNEIPIAGEDEEIMDMVEPSTPLPPWLTDEDMEIYGALYENSGFQTALQVPYRSTHKHLDIPDPKVEVPAMLIMGEADYVFKFPGMKEYIRSGEVKTYVPNLETIYVPEGTHFVQEQFPDQVNQLLLTFLSSRS